MYISCKKGKAAILQFLKKFWKTVKPLFSNKSKTANNNHENNKIIKGNKKTSHTLNKYFTNLRKTLKSKKISLALKKKSLKQLVLRHFKNNSTKKIKKHFNSKEIFTFREFKETGITRTIKELSENKASPFKDIQLKSWSVRFIFSLRYTQIFSMIV